MELLKATLYIFEYNKMLHDKKGKNCDSTTDIY
jgi:hypothetical protein